MKKICLLVSALLAVTAASSQDDLVIYGDGVEGVEWSNFAGPTNVQEVDNPSPDAVNSTGKCLQMLRPKETGESDEIGWPWEGALSESFSVLNIQDYNTITMLVKKPYPGRVALELQSPTGGSGMIYADYLATDNSWQKLTFPVQNVSGLGETGLTKVLIEIHREKENDNPDFEDCIMYADELVLHKAVPGFGFNGEDFITGCWLPFPSDEFSKRAMIVDNPDKSGINATNRCLWISREKNDDSFAGAINRNLRVLDLGGYEYFKMLVKKSIAGPVALEIQSPGEAQKQVLTADYTNAGEWQELHFDIPEGVLAGEPLQIIILQAHAVDTKEDASFTEPIDVYVDELYLVGNGSSISMTEFDEARIVRTDVYDINGMRVATYGEGESIEAGHALGKGLYLVRSMDEAGRVNVKKVIR